jgi:hypothetical protein
MFTITAFFVIIVLNTKLYDFEFETESYSKKRVVLTKPAATIGG